MARFPNMTMTREVHIPKGFEEIKRVDALGVLVVADPSRLIVMAFAGKAQKPAFYLRFRSVERAEAHVAEWFARIERRAEQKRAEREARKEEGHPLEVGTVLVSSWGWEQTNIDYYEVVKVIGKTTVEVREIAQESKETSSMQGVCIPVPGRYVGEAMRRRTNARGLVKIDSCRSASPASFKMIAGCKIYDARSWTAYA